jgi:hypothetical protein
MRKRIVSVLNTILCAAGIFAQAPNAPTGAIARGDWLGQPPPGDRPVPFAAEILGAVNTWVEHIDFSPDGSLCLIAVGSADYSRAKLLCSRRVKDAWTPFAEPPFIAGFAYTSEPVFAADGNTLYFTAASGTGSKDLWSVSYSGREWGRPVALSAPINSEANEFRACLGSDGTLYFGSERGEVMRVFASHRDAAGAIVVEPLPSPVNVAAYDGDPCVAPDGRFIVFYSCRSGGHGGADLYVSFADGKGGWKAPLNLGDTFNEKADQFGAHLSADGMYLFFTRHSQGGDTIYWVSVSAIDRLGG